MKISAVIFDLDGTVLSNEDEWGEAFKRVLNRLGIEEKANYPHVGGIGISENWPIFIEKYNIKTDKDINELAAETKKEYLKLIEKVTLKKGFKKFVTDLRDLGIKVGLATSSTWDSVEKIFAKLPIKGYFDSITTGEEAGSKKPNPEIFRIAAEKLLVDPEVCLVFEDSQAGIEAARAAKMKVIGVYRSSEHKSELNKANRLIKNFEEIDANILLEL